ncbi:hypothetical protein Tco_0039327, partial [Tanacetum coccineum]
MVRSPGTPFALHLTLIVPIFAQSVATSVGPATISPIPSNTTSERPHGITTVFAVTTPENTPFAYRASTSANPNPMISLAFVEANYEVLESLLRERQRQIRNKDLQIELEYFSEDYDEEREMELRPEPNREATPTLRLRSPVVRKQRERVMGFEEAPNMEESSLHTPTVLVPIHVNPYSQPSAGLVNGQTPNFPFQTQIGNPPARGISTYHPQGGYRPYTFTNNGVPSYNGSMYPSVTPSNSTGSVTPFVRWIEDYPLLDRLKMPSHIGSYDGKGDPDTFLHLFKGAIHMQKWLMPVACHMFTYTLKDSAHIWWNSQKTCSILNYEDLKAKFRSHFNLGLHEEQRISGFVHGLRTRSLVEHLFTDLPSTYKGLMEKTYTWIEARKVATNGTPNDRRENFERSRKSSWDSNRGQKGRDRFSPYRGPNHGLLSNLSKSPGEILATEKAARSFEQPPRQLSHLVKGIKKERVKASENQRTEGKKDKSTTPAEAPIIMIRQDELYTNNKFEGLTSEGKEITFPSGG